MICGHRCLSLFARVFFGIQPLEQIGPPLGDWVARKALQDFLENFAYAI